MKGLPIFTVSVTDKKHFSNVLTVNKIAYLGHGVYIMSRKN